MEDLIPIVRAHERAAEIQPVRATRQIPAATPDSEALSKDLKRRGFCLVGPNGYTLHAEPVGIVNDHLVGCFRYREIAEESKKMRAR